MSGREGLVDTAVKTSRSGYLQRCLIKHLEELRVHYDYSVRDSDGAMVQTVYGEDGLDTMQTAYLTGADDKLTFLARNAMALSQQYGISSSNFQRSMSGLNMNGTQDMVKGLLACRGAFASTVLPPGLPVSGTLEGTLPWSAVASLPLSKGQTVELRMPRKFNSDSFEERPHPLVLNALQKSSKIEPSALPDNVTVNDIPDSVTIDGRKLFTLAHLVGSKVSGTVDAAAISTVFHRVEVSKVRTSDNADENDCGSCDLKFWISLPIAMHTESGNSLDFTDSVGTTYRSVRVTVRKVPIALALRASAAASDAASATALLLVRPCLIDPIMSQVNAATHLGAMGEALLGKVNSYMQRNPNKALRAPTAPAGAGSALSAAAFNVLLAVKAQRALVHPGEPVGVLAGQGVGEPSTQMTLNTFHLAGGGGVNVTLGIPRLREIVMTASANIKTPAMTIPLLHGIEKHGVDFSRLVAGRIARHLSPLPLSDLLAVDRIDGGINVTEALKPLGGIVAAGRSQWIREYSVRLHFSGAAAIEGAFGLDFNGLAATVATTFAPKLLQIITGDLRKAARASGVTKSDKGVDESNAIGGREEDDTALLNAVGVGKAKDALPTAADEDDGEGAAAAAANNKPKRGKKSAVPAARKSNDTDTDDEDGDEEDDDNDAAAADKGTLRLGRRKQVSGYDDMDEEEATKDGAGSKKGESDNESSSSSSSSGSDSSSDSGSDSDSDSGSSASSSSVSIIAKKAKKGKAAAASDAKKKPTEKKRLTSKAVQKHAKAEAQEQTYDKDIFRVDAPDALLRNPRFGGILACRSGKLPGEDDDEHMNGASGTTAGTRYDPWVQVTVVFPASARKVLMLGSAERAATASLVRETKGITRAIVDRVRLGGAGSEERTVIHTEGVSLQAVWALAATLATSAGDSAEHTGLSPHSPVIDIHHLYSNDIAAILRTYGVEAARAAIVREMRNVFDAYHINVDIRHLFLIADYMTQGGGFRAMNRAGIEAHGSPYLKMSFETTMGFLINALVQGEHDRMTSPSARIVTGRVVDSGTGAFDLWSPAYTPSEEVVA
jgi:hypothetical protein